MNSGPARCELAITAGSCVRPVTSSPASSGLPALNSHKPPN
jgi:hypothetical protein